MIDDFKKQLKDLENRKNIVEKEINNANAKYDAQIDLLKKEFNIDKEGDIPNLISELESKIEDDKKKLEEAFIKLKKAVEQLEGIINGK